MEDEEFIFKIKGRIESSSRISINLEIDYEDPSIFRIEFFGNEPHVVLGSSVLEHAGLARLYMEYAVLCLREGRMVNQEEFLVFLRRN
jgi:hypothetical protein